MLKFDHVAYDANQAAVCFVKEGGKEGRKAGGKPVRGQMRLVIRSIVRNNEEAERSAVNPGAAAERRLGNRQHFTLHSFSVITGLLRALMGLIKRQR